MIKILVTGFGGSSNRGCEAIVRSTVDILNQHFFSSITILSKDPASDFDMQLNKLQNVTIPSVVTSFPRKYSLKWILSGVRRRLIDGFPSYFSYANRYLYRTSDLVLSIGGDNFTDDYEGPSHFFRELSYARSMGALTAIWGATIGPFKKKSCEKKWIKELRKADLITVRESKSLKYLNQIGIRENVKLVADPAFLLKVDPSKINSLNLKSSNRLVGIGMSAIVAAYGSSFEKYIESFIKFIKTLLLDANTSLILVPHVIDKNKSCDDEKICKLVRDRLDDKDRISLVNSNFNACQIKHAISQCDYFIGARTHTTIASLSTNVPTISIAYSTKAFAINEQIFGHTEYVLPIRELNEMSLKEKFLLISKRRNEISKQLANRIPSIKKMASKAGSYLADLLQHYYRLQDLKRPY